MAAEAQQKVTCGNKLRLKPKVELVDESILLGIPQQPPKKRAKNNLVSGQPFQVEIYTAYLGQVRLTCTDRGNGNVAMVAMIQSMQPGTLPNIYVKAVSASLNSLDPVNQNYDLHFLQGLPPVVVNVNKCITNWQLIVALKDKPNKTPNEQQQLQQALIYNNAVDVHFLTCKYIQFLHDKIGINNVINPNMLLSIVDVKNLDNAFFTGSYMTYGDGADLFYPLGCPDVAGHELGHGIVQALCGLEYEGHPGSLNESYVLIH